MAMGNKQLANGNGQLAMGNKQLANGNWQRRIIIPSVQPSSTAFNLLQQH
jgi:X-X-X-Leu-X-X-Gly heptad repeat protein